MMCLLSELRNQNLESESLTEFTSQNKNGNQNQNQDCEPTTI